MQSQRSIARKGKGRVNSASTFSVFLKATLADLSRQLMPLFRRRLLQMRRESVSLILDRSKSSRPPLAKSRRYGNLGSI